MVACDVDGVVYSGNVVGYDEDAEAWLIVLNDSSEYCMNYVELCEAKQLYDAVSDMDGNNGDDSIADNP